MMRGKNKGESKPRRNAGSKLDGLVEAVMH